MLWVRELHGKIVWEFFSWQNLSTSNFQSEVGEVFGEIGGELPAKFGRRFSSFFCWGKSSEAFSTKTPPQISPSNFTTRFWVVAGPRKSHCNYIKECSRNKNRNNLRLECTPKDQQEASITWCDSCIGIGPNTVSESTVSNTELSEFFWPLPSSGERAQWVPLSLLFVCQSELTEFAAELSEFSLPKQCSRSSISGTQKGPAERGHVKKRQKSSKSVKNILHSGSEKGVFWKRGLSRIWPFSRDSREFWDFIEVLEIPPAKRPLL